MQANWETDKAGVSLPLNFELRDTYSEDAYLRSLAVIRTPCFGQFRQGSPVCNSCPLVRSCQDQLVGAYARVALDFDPNYVPTTSASPTYTTRTLSDLEKIIQELEQKATVSSEDVLCCKCRKTIPSGTPSGFLLGQGTAHLGCLSGT